MCGICGFNWDDRKLVKCMSDKLIHRGPDSYGYFNSKGVSLGHRRLSIIDLSKKADQPMMNEDGSVVVVFNGEIYNFIELRSELELRGHRFSSDSDTEVIAHAYEEYGDECVKSFNGCFAFAVWDDANKKFFLARDRHGIKPLYYYFDGRKFIFASEIKAILEHDVKREVNLNALYSMLTFRCNSEFETMFKGIFKLKPGCCMTLQNDIINVESYWEYPLFRRQNSSVDYFSKKLNKLIEDSVSKRLVSDVSIGAYLSGGIDSATVVGMMKKLQGDVKTFSIGFENASEFNELSKAKLISDYFGTDHREIMVKVDTIKLLPNIVWHLDEPMADPTCIPVYLLSQGTKKHATVVLTGDGGDEQFGGYEQFKFMLMYKNYLQKVPVLLRKVLADVAKGIPAFAFSRFFKYAEGLGVKGISRMANFLSAKSSGDAYLSMVSVFDEDEKDEIIVEDSIKLNYPLKFNEAFSKYNDFLFTTMKIDTMNILTENMLMKTDKMTMANAIEARVPFLDHRITEFCASVPSQYKIHRGNEKYILKKAMDGLLPRSTLQTKKQRFFVPIDNWFSTELNDYIKQKLDRRVIEQQGIFDYKYIDRLFRNFKSSRLYYSRQLWCLLSFQLWYEQFMV